MSHILFIKFEVCSHIVCNTGQFMINYYINKSLFLNHGANASKLFRTDP